MHRVDWLGLTKFEWGKTDGVVEKSKGQHVGHAIETGWLAKGRCMQGHNE